ncbi:MAG: FeoA family protein [Thermoguttaceae bacterium]
MPDREIPLDRLQPGQPAYVTRILGRPEDVLRLEEFGLRGGTRVELFRPGSPCILRMAGPKVCLRVDGRVRVLVRPVSMPG